MIPDKIYIPKNVAPHLTEEWASLTHGDLDEYIRKDALLEWLEQNRNQSQMWFDRYHEKEDLSTKQVWEEVIDKINSL